MTRDNYLKFRHLDTQSFSSSPSSYHQPSKIKVSFQGEFKHPATSESQTALNNFKKGTKRDASVYPIFKNDKYYDTFQRSFLANLKAQGLYDVADPDHDPESGDIYEQELFQGKQSFVYSVLVTSLQTEKGRELVKEFEGDARSIILKLHHYHTKSNVAQHDIITLTTEITNLTLNDSWKGTVRQFLSHFKAKLRLLDSLVPASDQLPETTRLTFLQRAVQQNHDIRQIHVIDSVWRFKTDSTEALTFDKYYNLLWDAAHQYDLHQIKKGPQRKAFFSPSSYHQPSKIKTSFQGEFKHPATSESQTALNNVKKRTKRDASVYPIFKSDKYYDTFQRSFLANLKAQGLYDVAEPDHDPESGDIYEQELFKGKQSFVYSVLVTSLQTEKGRELVKEFEGDARSIILKLHHYHTKSNVAQHDIITLTTEITNLTLNDSWKGTVRQFLSHFKAKLRLLDSLVPVSDQLPETTRLTFLQRAVQQNHDLRQIHVMNSVWRFKTDSTEALTFDTYYNLLWDAAHQYDIHQTKKGPQRKAFFSQQKEINDDDAYANAEEQFSTDPEPVEHSPYSVYQSSFHPKMPQKSFLPRHIWETLSESTKQMIIEHNKKVKLNNPTPYPSGSKTKPNPTLGKSTLAPKTSSSTFTG